ncbi:MAG: MlaD family protein [Caulobacteraceae bacterium]
MSDTGQRRTTADTRRSWGPGWIWAVPIAALGVVIWLLVRGLAQGGEEVTVLFDNAYGMKGGEAPVMLRGVKVGEVESVALQPGAAGVKLKLKLDKDVSHYLTTGARFWLVGAKIDFADPASFKGLLSGPTIDMDPGPGKPATVFHGLDQPPPVIQAMGPHVDYRATFSGAVGELKIGAPVMLKGFRVGRVTDVGIAYDPATGALETPVDIALEPVLFHLQGPATGGDWRSPMDAMLQRLIGQGLRARLVQTPLLIGDRQVDLDFTPGAAPATLGQEGGRETIPTTSSGDISSITAHADQVLTEVGTIPFTQIGDNVRAITVRIRAVANSPKIDDSLDHLDASLAEIDKAVHQAGPQVGPLVKKLRQTADQADDTAAAARRLIAGDPTSQDADLPSAIRELTGAARSIRVLADELERHPEALIQGKAKPKGTK